MAETTTNSQIAGSQPPPATTPAPQSGTAQPAAPRTISDSAYDQLQTDADRDRYSRVRKGPDGGSEWRERASLQSETDPASKSATGDTAKPGEAPAVTVDGKLRVGSYELSSDDISMLMQERAARELRATQVPADPSGYEPKLPEGLQLPEGIDFRPDLSDPSFKDFQALSKKLGLTQSDFEQLYGIWVNKTVQSEVAFRNSMKTELDALGAHATMRVTALETWLRGTVGDELAKHMRAGMFSAKIVQGLETIQKKMVSQGAASFRQDGREPPGNAKGPLSSLSEAEYGALSAAERFRLSRLG
jgi:hypothetical protein